MAVKLSQIEWVPVGKAAIKEYSKDDVPGLAAEMAYWIVFSIFPFFVFLATLVGIVGQLIGMQNLLENIMTGLYDAMGQANAERVRPALEGVLSGGGGAFSFAAIISALLALNSASTAVTTIMKAFNRAYGVEETRNFIQKKWTAIWLTLVLLVLLVGGSLLLSLGGQIANALNLGIAGRILLFIVRIVGALLGVAAALAILYWKGPNLKQSFQFITPGSVIATIVLLLLSGLFGIYVSFASQSTAKTYGALAGAILFLLFLRLASTVILLGAEFNAETAKRYDPEAIRDKVTDPRKQLPGKQPTPHPQAAREAGVSQGQVTATNTSSARKLAAGEGSPATAAMAQAATANNGSGGGANGAASYLPEDFDDPSLDEQLRAIRERPFVSAAEQARAQQSHLSGTERAQRVRTTLTAFAISAATAIGGIVFGTLRRANR